MCMLFRSQREAREAIETIQVHPLYPPQAPSSPAFSGADALPRPELSHRELGKHTVHTSDGAEVPSRHQITSEGLEHIHRGDTMIVQQPSECCMSNVY